MVTTTAQVLANITDEGVFEQLATAILREANPMYHALAHPGINLDGQTVKSPLDGICFVPGSDPLHIIAVHHTITDRDGLTRKWLNDPSKVKSRKTDRGPSAPAGDIIKTGQLVARERARNPSLKATLVLTTNEEPGEELMRTVAVAGYDLGLEIDVWPRSRLCHELDTRPSGQWLRSIFLGIDQEQLSPQLFHELSLKNLEAYSPPDDPKAWVPRGLDEKLTLDRRGNITFLVAESGMGKTIACYRWLAKHAQGGGFSFVLPHQTIASAQTLSQALLAELSQLHPPLTISNASPLAMCSPEQPVFIVIEDINRSGQASMLLEKLLGWGLRETISPLWHVICPLWPSNVTSLKDNIRQRIQPLIISADTYSDAEGEAAVLARLRLNGCDTSLLDARMISKALGHDPLLIALYDHTSKLDPHNVLQQFIDGSIARVAASTPEHPASDYREALLAMSREMLRNRKLDVSWTEIRGWFSSSPEVLRLLSRLAHQGELISLTKAAIDQQLTFRHDRVREELLINTAADLEFRGQLENEFVGDPWFAEIIGSILAREQSTPDLLARAVSMNPLALFHAYRLVGSRHLQKETQVFDSICTWLADPTTFNPSNAHLRWEALEKLAGTDSVKVPDIVGKFPDRTFGGMLARFRNGDLLGGIELCANFDPGTTAPWRDAMISHVKQRFNANLTRTLSVYLCKTDLGNTAIIGALRLAGHVAAPDLATGIETCWANDCRRSEHLREYLWAAAQCCGNDAARYLGPVCDAWAALQDSPDQYGTSPRANLAADHLRWAFRRWPPNAAIDYFINRAKHDDLNTPITIMLNGLDHPQAIAFLVEQLAKIRRSIVDRGSFSPFLSLSEDEWRRDNRVMSQVSRDLLLNLWLDKGNEKYSRIQAFALWAATRGNDDLQVLRKAQASDLDAFLANQILNARLVRGDSAAIPAMVQRLADPDKGHWWHLGRHVWSPMLTTALDAHLTQRGKSATREWGEHHTWDGIVSELLMDVSSLDSESLLLKHWDHLRYGADFVQAALYIASPKMIAAARASLAESAEPTKLLKYFAMHVGIKVYGRPGITRKEQIRALKPYVALLSDLDQFSLWELCNERGWFILRREVLDEVMQENWEQHKWRGMWNPSHFWCVLDEMLTNNRSVWLDHSIDAYFQAGVSRTELLDTMKAWLDSRRTLDAFGLLANAIQHCGTRDDIALLSDYEDISQEAVRHIVLNTKFVVYRRHLS